MFPGDNLLAHVLNAHNIGSALFLGEIKAVPTDYIRNQGSAGNGISLVV
jgi:hypothetical protein